MPFKSERQRKFMYAKHPDIAKRWQAEGKGNVAGKTTLPAKAGKTVSAPKKSTLPAKAAKVIKPPAKKAVAPRGAKPSYGVSSGVRPGFTAKAKGSSAVKRTATKRKGK